MNEEVVELRKLPTKEATELILKYIKTHQGCSTSDLIFELELDVDLVLSIVRELEQKEEIRGTIDNEQSVT